MLRPLLFVSAVIALAGAQQIFTKPSKFNISSCPITYYGQKYEQIYVNFTSNNFVVCFNGFYDPDNTGDCLLGPPANNMLANFQISVSSNSGFLVRQKSPAIKNSMECEVVFVMLFNADSVTVELLNFRTQSALYFETFYSGSLEFIALVNGTIVNRAMVTNTPQKKQMFNSFDMSQCRHSGVLYTYGAVVSSDPETCSKLTCSEIATLQTSGCGPLERCQGNDTCMLDTICTVTGPAVIDIHGQVNSVSDRCAYPLVLSESLQGFHVLANFQERRLKDVSFLDSVTLQQGEPNLYILLEQGGRVQVNSSLVTLSSVPQLVDGVELSEDQTGVTAKLLFSESTVSVFFDGYTAQIHIKGPAVSSLEGLCAKSSSSLSELRLSEYSSTSCEMHYNDTADSTINCNNVTERCNLLKEAPFTSCNSDIDPEPYITACTDTLCKYPAVDGLNCQFLKAYARACSLYGNHTLESWRSNASCSPQAFCLNRTCSAHEFCGEKTPGGDTRCFCRAIFASKYKSTDTLGNPTVCSQNSASVTLANCLLEDKGIDYSALHLNDQTCRAHMDELTHMVTFSFNSSNSCGMVVTANNNQVIYKNTIKTQNSSSDIITRDTVSIDFSCIQTQPDIKTGTFRIRDSSVIQYVTSGTWNYTVTMKTFTDAGHTQAVDSSTEVRLNQAIYVELGTSGLEGDIIAVVTDSCWATAQVSPTGIPRYDLIMNGCANPKDQTVKVEENGLGLSTYFSFNMFQFSENSGDVYLHCKLHLCIKEGSSCVPTCNGAARKRRSVKSKYEAEAPAFISMVWTN